MTRLLSTTVVFTMLAGATMAQTFHVEITKGDGRTEAFTGVGEPYVEVNSAGGRRIVIVDTNGEPIAYAYGVGVVARPEPAR